MKTVACLAFAVVLSLAGCASPSGKNADQNPVLENILARKSVRQYTSRPVEPEKIDLLLRAGMAAPSGSDKRPWSFVVVQDRARLDSMAVRLPYAKMLTKAPMAIVVCGDTLRSALWEQDCCAVTENILLAAESMGLGAVWTAAYPYPERMQVVRDALQLPEHIIPLTVIPLGYPTGQEKPKNKFNEQQIHYNKW